MVNWTMAKPGSRMCIGHQKYRSTTTTEGEFCTLPGVHSLSEGIGGI